MRRDLEVLPRYAFDAPSGDFFSVQICDKTVVIADLKPCGIASRFLRQVESDACVDGRVFAAHGNLGHVIIITIPKPGFSLPPLSVGGRATNIQSFGPQFKPCDSHL